MGLPGQVVEEGVREKRGAPGQGSRWETAGPESPEGSCPLMSQACMPQALRGRFVYAPASHRISPAKRDLLLAVKAPTCALLQWRGQARGVQQAWVRVHL